MRLFTDFNWGVGRSRIARRVVAMPGKRLLEVPENVEAKHGCSGLWDKRQGNSCLCAANLHSIVGGMIRAIGQHVCSDTILHKAWAKEGEPGASVCSLNAPGMA